MYCKTLLIITIFSTVIYAQDPKNLFYCNENNNLSKIYPLNQAQFLGLSVVGGTNYLMLYNESRLVVDTLELGSTDLFYLQALHVLNDTLFFFDALNKRGVYSVKGEKFKQIEMLENLDYSSGFPFYAYNGLSFSIKLHKKTKKNYIGYEILFQKGAKKGVVVENMKRETKHVLSGKLPSHFSWDGKHSVIYFPIETASKVVFFNTETLKKKEYQLPERQSGSWYIYYDYVADRLYALSINKESKNELYFINRKNFELKKIKEMEFLPKAIIDNHFHVIKLEKIKGGENKEIDCHYMIPLFDSENEATVLLDEIEIY